MSEPFHLVYQLCREANTPGFRFLERLSMEDENTNPVEKVADYVRMKAASASKLNTYVTDMNPNMTVHPVYVTKVFIPDFKRESFTRLRVMSHNLRVEVGRWSRTPREERVCQCNNTSVQTEKHVLIECLLSEPCRDRYPMLKFDSIIELLNENEFVSELCNYVHEVVKIYE